MRVKIHQISETAVRAQFSTTIEPGLTYILHDFVDRVTTDQKPGIGYCQFAYTTVTVHFDPWQISGRDVRTYLGTVAKPVSAKSVTSKGRLIEVPVCYGDDYGPDLFDVAAYHSTSPEEVIKRHSQPDYLVAFIGFSPGFPYLLGLAPSLATPRLNTPRQKVPAGSVGIGGEQTGIYPSESPAGWRIVGRTPLRLFDLDKVNPCLFAAGDSLRFVPVSSEQFLEIEAGL
jgi:inhibitor of KinA